MGSSFSILNDTQRDVWIIHGINWEVVTNVLRVISFLLTAGMAVAGARAANSPSTKEATRWNRAERFANVGAEFVQEPLCRAREEAQRVPIDDDKGFKAKAALIKPGEKYTFSGTLSLTMTVYVMNDKLQRDKKACFTGPTVDSENIYPISQYFTNLDVT